MKKIFIFICCFCATILVSCKQIQKDNQYSNIENQVATKLMQVDNNFSDETLKALSIVLRTNLSINNDTENSSCDNQKYLAIAKSTKGKVLKNSNGNLVEIGFENSNNYSWQKSIKKSELLEFAMKNNISLTNLSKINPIIENQKVIGLEIGDKFFDYNTLAQNFGLESNIIENITQTKNSINIYGKNKGFYGYFDINKAEQLSINNYIFEDILAEFFENLMVVKI